MGSKNLFCIDSFNSSILVYSTVGVKLLWWSSPCSSSIFRATKSAAPFKVFLRTDHNNRYRRRRSKLFGDTFSRFIVHVTNLFLRCAMDDVTNGTRMITFSTLAAICLCTMRFRQGWQKLETLYDFVRGYLLYVTSFCQLWKSSWEL